MVLGLACGDVAGVPVCGWCCVATSLGVCRGELMAWLEVVGLLRDSVVMV